MIQDVKLGIHKISSSVRSCSVFIWKCRNEAKRSINMGVEKGCGHKRGSSGVAYDDSYCNKF